VQGGAQHPAWLRLGGVGARHIQVLFGNPVGAVAVGLHLLARHDQHAVGPIALAQAGRAGLVCISTVSAVGSPVFSKVFNWM